MARVFAGTVFILFISFAAEVQGHGRLRSPAGRSSAWRSGFNTPINYNDNSLYCGGFAVQYYENNGQCGVCGDPYQGPLDNQPPNGQYATGTIVAVYTQGQIITAQVEITASHLGYFEFRICPHNDIYTPVTQECLDDNLLTLAGSQETKYGPIDHAATYFVNLQLPADVTCDQCVLQWRYHTGNSWGCDGTDCGKGKGNQEEFYACSDIKITQSGSTASTSSTPQGPTITTITPPSTNQESTTVDSVTSTSITSTSTAATVTTTSTTGSAGSCTGSFQCPTASGYYPDPCDCSKFYICSHYYAHSKNCGSGLVWNHPVLTCDWPFNYQCPYY